MYVVEKGDVGQAGDAFRNTRHSRWQLSGIFERFNEKHPKGWIAVQLLGCSSVPGMGFLSYGTLVRQRHHAVTACSTGVRYASSSRARLLAATATFLSFTWPNPRISSGRLASCTAAGRRPASSVAQNSSTSAT